MRSLFTGVRARATLAATLALGIVGGAVVTATTATAATRTTVTAKSTAASAYTGTAVYLKGSVNPTTLARTVYLQRYASARWSNVTSATTAKGAYTLRIPTSTASAYSYRVYAPAKGAYAAGYSTAVKVTVVRKTTTTGYVTPSTVKWGGTSYLKGVISPARSGRTVSAQYYDYDKKTWVTLASGKTTTTGSFSIPVRAYHPRGWSYNLRAYVSGMTGYSAAASKTVLLKSITGNGYWTRPDGCLTWFTDNGGFYAPPSDAPARCFVGM